MEGYLDKRTRAVLKSVWHRRYFALSPAGILSWSAAPGDPAKDSIPVTGGAIVVLGDSKFKRQLCFSLTTPSTTLTLAAESNHDFSRWMAALQSGVAAASKRPAFGETARSSNSSIAGGGGSSISISVGVGSGSNSNGGNTSGTDSSADATAQPPTSALPTALSIEGWPVVGEELRLVCSAEGAPLDACSPQWVRLLGGGGVAVDPPASSDLTAVSKNIPSATAATYAITAEDVGSRLGCVVRVVGGGVSGTRWALQSRPVVAAEGKATPTLALTLQPHEHNKYCDRRIRVCTSAGKYREGAVLVATPPPPTSPATAAAGGGGVLAWYRSERVVSRHHPVGEEGGGGGSSSAHAGSIVQPSAWCSGLTHGGGSPASGPGPLYRVHPRPLHHLPPAPPDHAPAVPIVDLKVKLASMAAPWPPSSPFEPSSPLSYPLFAEDTGCVIAAAWVAAGAPPPPVLLPPATAAAATDDSGRYVLSPSVKLLSRCVGPIEAAPPRAREIWIEGDAVVGGTLTGHYFYFGGLEGPTEVSWVAIDDAGDVVELRPPQALPTPSLAAYKAMAYTSSSGGGGGAAVYDASAGGTGSGGGGLDGAHPAVLRLTGGHLGSLVKFKVRPVRIDGDEGHAESSRPTGEVTAATRGPGAEP